MSKILFTITDRHGLHVQTPFADQASALTRGLIGGAQLAAARPGDRYEIHSREHGSTYVEVKKG